VRYSKSQKNVYNVGAHFSARYFTDENSRSGDSDKFQLRLRNAVGSVCINGKQVWRKMHKKERERGI